MFKQIFSLLFIAKLGLAGAQITPQKLQGTWTLCALNGNDDSSLVFVFDRDFKAEKYFKHHALNNIWEISDNQKHKYFNDFSKFQLSDPTTISYLEQQKTVFFQFDTAYHFKENTAEDSTFKTENVELGASLTQMLFEGKLPSFELHGDTVFIKNGIHGNSAVVAFYTVKLEKDLAFFYDALGTLWVMKLKSRQPLFQFENKTEN